MHKRTFPGFGFRSRNTPKDSSNPPPPASAPAPAPTHAPHLPPQPPPAPVPAPSPSLQPGSSVQSNSGHSKMMHNMKLQLKGAGKKKILREDTGLAATDNTLSEWHSSVSALLNAINANENAWRGLFSTFDAFHPIATSIYPQEDTDAFEFCNSLSAIKKQLESPPPGVESYVDAKQRIDITKKDLENLLSRIGNARAMQANRIEVTREYRYYADKTQSMTQAEQKKSQGPTEKDVERRQRNEQHVANKSTELHSLTNQLFHEMDAIAVERLAATDRAMAAMLLLQHHYFASNPVSASYAIASRIGLGRRVLVRHEKRPWNPNDGKSNPVPEPTAPDMSSSSFGGPKTDSWIPQPMNTPATPQHHPGDTPMYAVPAINPNLTQQPSPMQGSPMTTQQYGSQYTPGPTTYSTPASQAPNSTGGYYNPSGLQQGGMDAAYYNQQQHVFGTSQDYSQQQASYQYGGGLQTPPPPPPPPPPEDPSMNSQPRGSTPMPTPPATTGVQQSTTAPPPPSVEPPHPGALSQGSFMLPESTHVMPGQSPAPIYTSASSMGGAANPLDNSTSSIPPPPPPPPPYESQESDVMKSGREKSRDDEGFVDAN